MAEETRRTKDEWVEETYRIFIRDAEGIDPTDPVKALEAYFEANAPEDLKARCAAEGKTASKCWKFVCAVARKALKGSNGHIDPAVVYAIAMHWFQDVPVDWDRPKTASDVGATDENGYRSDDQKDVEAARRADELAIQTRVANGITEIPKTLLKRPWCDELAQKYNLSRPKPSAKEQRAEAERRAAEEKASDEREARENPLGLDAARVEADPAEKPAKKPKKKPVRGTRKSQGFFFDLMEPKEGSAE